MPDAADAMAIPVAEEVAVWATDPMVFLETVALVTSLPVNPVGATKSAEKPSDMPKASNEETPLLMPEIEFSVI